MTDSREEIWRPLPGAQTTFLTCPVFEALFDGTRGCGKSEALLIDFAQHCGQGFGADWRGIIFRRTFRQLVDIIKKSRLIFHRAFPDAKYNKSDFTWTWPDGEELLLRYMDDEDSYWEVHGMEFAFVGFDELTTWPNLDAYHLVKSCCRSTNPTMPRKYRATANPWGRGHNAVKAYFVDPAPPGTIVTDEDGLERVRIHGSWVENTVLLEADPSYPNKIAASASNPQQKKAWLKGDWNVSIGGMFDDLWRDESDAWPRHVVEPFKIPVTWRIDRAFDWGSSAPYSVQWWAESDGSEVKLADGSLHTFPRGTLFLVDEIYGWNGEPNSGIGESTYGIAKKMKEVEANSPILAGLKIVPGPADSQIWNRDGGRCINDEFRHAGIRWNKANKAPGTRILGWQLLRERLQASLDQPMERPGLFVFDNCRDGFIRTISGVQRDDKNPDDLEKEAEDHSLDAARYRCLERSGIRTIRAL